MPNLRGLLSFVGGSFAVEVALGLVVVAAVWFLSRREPLPAVGAIALAGGLLLGHHSYFYDAVLLIPAVLLPFDAARREPTERRLQSKLAAPQWMRYWAVLLITPVPYLLLLTNAGIVGHIAISGYTLALIAVTVIHRRADGMEPGSSLPQYPG